LLLLLFWCFCYYYYCYYYCHHYLFVLSIRSEEHTKYRFHHLKILHDCHLRYFYSQHFLHNIYVL